MSKNRSQRGGVSKKDGKAVIVYFPPNVVDKIDTLVRKEDTDRSKWIRKVVKNAMSKIN